MQQPPLREERTSKQLTHRLDRLFGDINAFLIALAIGLAILDFTCFTALRMIAATQASAANEATQTGGIAPSMGGAFQPQH